MERLAERIVLGKLGPIGHTIRLTDGTSWDKIVRDNNMSLTLRDKLRRDAEDVVQRAVEMFEMNMRSRKKNVDEDEIDRLQNENTRALPPHPTPPPPTPRASSPPPPPPSPRLPCQHH